MVILPGQGSVLESEKEFGKGVLERILKHLSMEALGCITPSTDNCLRVFGEITTYESCSPVDRERNDDTLGRRKLLGTKYHF